MPGNDIHTPPSKRLYAVPFVLFFVFVVPTSAFDKVLESFLSVCAYVKCCKGRGLTFQRAGPTFNGLLTFKTLRFISTCSQFRCSSYFTKMYPGDTTLVRPVQSTGLLDFTEFLCFFVSWFLCFFLAFCFLMI